MAKVVLSGVALAGLLLTSTEERDVKEGATLTASLLPRPSCSCSSIAIARRPPLSPLHQHPRCSSVSPVFVKPGSRFALYGDCQDYVLIEPGKDERFVDLEELRARLRKWLENWPGSSLPTDLTRFDDLDDAVAYLVESACELEITDGSGTVQWFEVRL